MSDDLKQLYPIFFEEAAELLTAIERRLLESSEDGAASPDRAIWDGMLRAVHSIKGGAATFGFGDMAQLAHRMESSIAKLRDDGGTPAEGTIDTLLQARDVLKQELDAHQAADRSRLAADALSSQLDALAGTPAQAVDEASGSKQSSAPPSRVFRIQFPASGLSAQAVADLLTDLADQGSLEALASNEEGTQYHVLRLSTGADEADIWQALAFSVDPHQLKIVAEPSVPTSGATLSPVSAIARLPADDTGGNQGERRSGERTSGGRRATDRPDALVARTGRRNNDKVVTDAAIATVRVAVDKIDHVAAQIAQLERTYAALGALATEAGWRGRADLAAVLSGFERDIAALTQSLGGMRKVQIGEVFQRFPRLARDLAAKLNKQVELDMLSEQTELARELIERIADPLTHLVRNSIDHGIEAPDQRVALGKRARGKLTLSACEAAGQVVLEVRDDGAGLSREKILDRAAQCGLSIENDMTDDAVWLLIFEPGFSTADTLSEVSGRGIGMDIVKTSIEALGGHIEIKSQAGTGTRFLLYLPAANATLSPLPAAAPAQP